MRHLRLFPIVTAAVCLALAVPALQAGEQEKISGIGPISKVVKVQGGFQFTEGPASDGHGNLYFTDIPGNRINKLGTDGKVSVFLEPSNHCNGLMFDAAGKLFAAEMDGRIVTIDVATRKVSPLVSEYEGKRLNAPNDVVVDRQGGVYFTDPRYRAPMPWPQVKEAVYYRATDGKVTRLVDDLPAPNGVILSPDEQTLYVIPSLQKEMMAYTVKGPGKIADARVFCSLKQRDDSKGAGSGGDGLTIDTKGNVYITSNLGVQVFDPAGKLLGIIEFPEQPANVTFGGKEGKTLYATARTSLYAVEMEAIGHQFPGKK